MNERIRELLEQAGVKYVVMPKDTVYEKFAELIVKECADVAKQFYKNNKEYDASLAIEQHFGVEE